MLYAIFFLLLIALFPLLSFILGVGMMGVFFAIGTFIASYWWAICLLFVVGFLINTKFNKSNLGIDEEQEEDKPLIKQSAVNRLEQLNQMREKGLVSQEEYDSKRQSILDNL